MLVRGSPQPEKANEKHEISPSFFYLSGFKSYHGEKMASLVTKNEGSYVNLHNQIGIQA